MCGRYRIKDPELMAEYLRTHFGVADTQTAPRYNIAPSLEVPVIILDDDGDVQPIPPLMRWGFVPFWEKEAKPRTAPINAKSEGIVANALFRHAVQQRRCLVPADGFYEWLRFDEKTRYAFDIHLRRDRPFVMAGVYERATKLRPATFAILTTRPNSLMEKIHDRMPVILDEAESKAWLRRGEITGKEIDTLAAPHAAEDMEAIPISALVNSPQNDMPEVLEPVAFAPPPKPPKQEQGELF